MHIDKVWAATSMRTGHSGLIASVVPSEARASAASAAPEAAMLSVEPVRTANRGEKPKRCCSPGAID